MWAPRTRVSWFKGMGSMVMSVPVEVYADRLGWGSASV